MAQHSFDFSPKPNESAKEIQCWVAKHNQQVIAATRSPNFPPGSLLGALDGREAKANAVYLLRGVLSQQLRRSTGVGSFLTKKRFLKALRAEIVLKKTAQDPIFTVRNTLMYTSFSE